MPIYCSLRIYGSLKLPHSRAWPRAFSLMARGRRYGPRLQSKLAPWDPRYNHEHWMHTHAHVLDTHCGADPELLLVHPSQAAQVTPLSA